MDELVRQQQAIGWDHVLRGNLSLSWVRTFDNMHNTTSGEQWGISLLKKIWVEFYSMWKKRCDHQHGTDSARNHEILLQELTPKVTQLYLESEQLLHVDQFPFRISQEQILQLPPHRLETWISKTERHVKQARTRAKRQAKQTATSIRDFYPMFTPTTPSMHHDAIAPATMNTRTSRKTIITRRKIMKPSTTRRQSNAPQPSVRHYFQPKVSGNNLMNPYAKPHQPQPARTPPNLTSSQYSSLPITSYFGAKPKDSFPHHNTERPP
jgi:hypothetical protein